MQDWREDAGSLDDRDTETKRQERQQNLTRRLQTDEMKNNEHVAARRSRGHDALETDSRCCLKMFE